MTATVVDRFLRYVVIDTQSDAASSTQPSTEKQKNLGRVLVEDLLAWVLPSLALGLALGRWLVRGTTVVALVAATTLLALLNPLPWQDGPLDWGEFGAVFFMLALNPGGLVLVALLAGARLGKHWAWKSMALAR